MRLLRSLLAVVLLVGLASCARAPVTGLGDGLRRTGAPELSDDMPLEPLLKAVETHIQFLEKSPNFSRFVFGETVFEKAEYLAALCRFVALGRKAASSEEFFKTIRDEFEFYEVYGQKSWGDAFISSYYEPVLEGSLKKSDRFSQPLYQIPKDMLALDLAKFDEKYKGDRKLRGRVEGGEILPYYSREEIDVGGKLKGKRLELAWLDPIDSFFLQVQGSGMIRLPKGKVLRVGYAEKNGQRYESIGKFMKDRLPPDKVNLHTIETYLRSVSREEMQRYLNMNPSYVFFRKLEDNAITSLGVPASEGRTIATDPKFSPKGALAFLSSTKPVFETIDSHEPKEWVPFSRFVLDEDVGGGITGSGRVDLFWGAGWDAKRHAGVMKQPGKLYYLAPKKGGQYVRR